MALSPKDATPTPAPAPDRAPAPGPDPDPAPQSEPITIRSFLDSDRQSCSHGFKQFHTDNLKCEEERVLSIVDLTLYQDKALPKHEFLVAKLQYSNLSYDLHIRIDRGADEAGSLGSLPTLAKNVPVTDKITLVRQFDHEAQTDTSFRLAFLLFNPAGRPQLATILNAGHEWIMTTNGYTINKDNCWFASRHLVYRMARRFRPRRIDCFVAWSPEEQVEWRRTNSSSREWMPCSDTREEGNFRVGATSEQLEIMLQELADLMDLDLVLSLVGATGAALWAHGHLFGWSMWAGIVSLGAVSGVCLSRILYYLIFRPFRRTWAEFLVREQRAAENETV